MIDANARHMDIGKRFFLEVHSCDPSLCKNGVIRGDIVLAEIVERTEDHHKYTIQYYTEQDGLKNPYTYSVDMLDDEDDSKYYAFLVYSGLPDGTGFINDDWKAKAFKFMKGEWDVTN